MLIITSLKLLQEFRMIYNLILKDSDEIVFSHTAQRREEAYLFFLQLKQLSPKHFNNLFTVKEKINNE